MIMPEVKSFGFERCEPHKEAIDTVINFSALHFIESGEGVRNGRVLRAGQGFLNLRSKRISYRQDALNPWNYSWIDFVAPDMAQQLFSLIDFDSDLVFEFDRTLPYTQAIISAKNSVCGFEAASVWYRILHLLSKDSHKKTENTLSQMQKNAAEALRIIEKDYKNPDFSASSLAERLHLSRGYLRNIFSKYYGIPPTEYIVKTRINRACELLSETEYPIKIISRSVGWEDALAFSAIFKKHIGVSPSRYRNDNTIKGILQ
ncbi:MAG: AraC family transcriptional regulator [Clostridia bacterium]|nr:AraC family transcriptional regulator [Clostridia bacterium]